MNAPMPSRPQYYIQAPNVILKPDVSPWNGKKISGTAADVPDHGIGQAPSGPPVSQSVARPIRLRGGIEDVIASGEFAIPPGEPAAAVITDKRFVAHLGLADVIQQIRARYELYRRHFRDIEYAKCTITNALHRWEAERGSPSAEQISTLYQVLQRLEAEQRSERITLWRDISRLRLELPDHAREYLAALRKEDLLSVPRGDQN